MKTLQIEISCKKSILSEKQKRINSPISFDGGGGEAGMKHWMRTADITTARIPIDFRRRFQSPSISVLFTCAHCVWFAALLTASCTTFQIYSKTVWHFGNVIFVFVFVHFAHVNAFFPFIVLFSLVKCCVCSFIFDSYWKINQSSTATQTSTNPHPKVQLNLIINIFYVWFWLFNSVEAKHIIGRNIFRHILISFFPLLVFFYCVQFFFGCCCRLELVSLLYGILKWCVCITFR